MTQTKLYISNPYLIIFKVYFFSLMVFSLFRFYTLFLGLRKVAEVELFPLLTAFVVGLRFDVIVVSFALLIPSIIFFINYYYIRSTLFYKATLWLIFILFSVTFFFTSSDLPYFYQFFDRLSVSIFLWNDDTNLQVSTFYDWDTFLPILFFLLIEIIFFLQIKKWTKLSFLTTQNPPKTYLYLFLILYFFSIRGKLDFSTSITNTKDAYFSSYHFANKLALNPIFTLVTSYFTSKKSYPLHFIDEQTALKNVKKHLNIKNTNNLERVTKGTPNTLKKNVVLIIMESMGKQKMGRYGNTSHLTPNLDSLAQRGITFDNFYSAGIHTYNGIFSTLYSFPAIYRYQPMKTTANNSFYDGLPVSLKKHGYNTAFFTTHNEKFDNTGTFLTQHGFDSIYSDKDYPKEKIISPWGVSDGYLFDYGIKELNKLATKEEPFLSVFMTGSDHSPYIIPSNFAAKSKDPTQKVVEYADWAIGNFMQECAKQAWFSNTLFILVADHGHTASVSYDMPLELNQIPCIFYAPNFVQTQEITSLGMQIDVFPVAMHLLQLPYTNRTMGINLLEQKRPYAYFGGDDKIGIVTDSIFYIYKDYDDEFIYRFGEKNIPIYTLNNKREIKSAKKYAFSFLQHYQTNINNLNNEDNNKLK